MSSLIKRLGIPEKLYKNALCIAKAIKKGDKVYFNNPIPYGRKTIYKIVLLRCGLKIPRKIKKKLLKNKLTPEQKIKLFTEFDLYYSRKILLRNSIKHIHIQFKKL